MHSVIADNRIPFSVYAQFTFAGVLRGANHRLYTLCAYQIFDFPKQYRVFVPLFTHIGTKSDDIFWCNRLLSVQYACVRSSWRSLDAVDCVDTVDIHICPRPVSFNAKPYERQFRKSECMSTTHISSSLNSGAPGVWVYH